VVQELLAFFHRGAVVFFLAEFYMVSNDKKETGEERGDENTERRDKELGIESAVFDLVTAVRYDYEGKKSVIHTRFPDSMALPTYGLSSHDG